MHSHLFSQIAKAFIVLSLCNCILFKECVQKGLLSSEQFYRLPAFFSHKVTVTCADLIQLFYFNPFGHTLIYKAKFLLYST